MHSSTSTIKTSVPTLVPSQDEFFIIQCQQRLSDAFFVHCQKFHNKVNNIEIIHPPTISNVTPPAGAWYNFCKLKPLSPKEAFEEDLLLQSIAWPDTPPLQSLSLRKSSDPAHSTFTILGRMGGGQWQIGDKMEVIIKMYDFQGRPKNCGGDVIVARLHNPTLGAGVAGKVVDHLNGSYSAVFSLLWEGSAQVEVILNFITLNAIVTVVDW